MILLKKIYYRNKIFKKNKDLTLNKSFKKFVPIFFIHDSFEKVTL